MRLLSWNCRGLGNPGTVQALKGLITSKGPDVVFVSETRKSTQEMCSMRRSFGISNLFPVACAGSGRSRAGGLCLLWNDEVEVQVLHASLNHILCMVTHPFSRSPVQILAVYGFPEVQRKHRTWELIARYKPLDPSVPWVCLGDFNDVLSPSDKSGGGQVNILHLQNINQTISACGLFDAGFSGFRFTWSNKRHEPHTVQERLDYALINDEWRAIWPVVEVSHLPRYKSDHNPVLVACYPHPRGERQKRIHMFRFEELWLDSGEECSTVVADAWLSPEGHIGNKIAAVGSMLDSWGRDRYGDIPKKVADKKSQLQALQGMFQSDHVLEETREVECELDSLLHQEEILWAQRSRANWLKHGDRNTRFFHQKATQRKKRNFIEQIADDRGVRWIDDNNISRVLTDYFVELFRSSDPVDIEDTTRLMAGRVSPEMLVSLNAPFTRDEVEEALFQMHPNKAPGIDCLPALFYQKFWHIVGDDVVHFCLQVLGGHLSPGMINQTLIVLIPKVKEPLHANQFRPISLCNVLFKIITKTIANRLKLVLPDLVRGPQSAFVPGRLITDNALIAYECFHFMKKKCSGRNGHMALKLDMSKAYDRVEWPFLCSVLVQMGFPTSWVNLIMSCVTSVRFQVMLNGNPQMPFDPGRGLRQGDPLSPYLFILCGEVFSALIQRELARSTLSGIKIARNAPIVSHLLFADDSVIFAKATLEEAACVKQILASYERVSGQVINFDKSMLSCSRNVPSPRFDELKRLLNVKAVESYDKYLGLPTIIGKSKTQIFNFVKERVWKKLKGWKERSLSRMGREVMVKAVAQAIPSYIMSCFMLPDALCADIERMISRFYWSGDASKRSIHWLKWDTLCRSKYDGGVGFRDFKAFNTALVGKNWWRLQRNPETLLGRLFKAVYYPNTSIGAAKKGSRPSYAWTSIFRTRWVFEEGARWKVGNGQSIDIWRDKWIPGDVPLIYREELAHTANLQLVSHLFLPSMQAWNRDLVELVFWPPTAKAILQIPLPRLASGDELYWPFTTDGLYVTKSGYDFIRQRKVVSAASSSGVPQVQVKFWKSLWKVLALPRCIEVAWRAVKGILPVRKLLHVRGVDIEEVCPFCNEEDESINHILVLCPVVRRWWFALLGSLRVEAYGSVHGILQYCFDSNDADMATRCVNFVWAIWEARNRLVFQSITPSLDDLASRLKMIHAPLRDSIAPPGRDLAAVWRRPQPDVIKLNFDGSWKNDRAAGFGCVARNQYGEVMAAATASPVDASSPLMAEVLAFRWCLSLAADLFFHDIELETDCLQLFDAWHKSLQGASYFISVLKDCKDLVLSFSSFRLSFVRRSGNSVADYLAKNSSRYPNYVWIEEVPPDCVGLVASDVTASMASCF